MKNRRLSHSVNIKGQGTIQSGYFGYLMGGTILLSCEGYEITLWDVATGLKLSTPLMKLPHAKSRNYWSDCDPLVLSPNGQLLAVIDSDLNLKVFDVRSGKQVKSYKQDSMVWPRAISPDGNLLVVSDSPVEERASLKIINLHSDRLVKTTTITDEGIVTFSPNGTLLLLENDLIRLIDKSSIKAHKIHHELGFPDFVGVSHDSVLIGGDSTKLVKGEYQKKTWLHGWDLKTKESIDLSAIRPSLKALNFEPDTLSPDGRWLAGDREDGTVQLMEIPSGNLGPVLGYATKELTSTSWRNSWLTSNDELLWTWSYKDHLDSINLVTGYTSRLYLFPEGKPIELLHGVKKLPYSVTVHPDGTLVAVGFNDGEIKIFNAKTGEVKRSLKHPFLGTVHFSPDGNWLLSNGSGLIIIRSVNTNNVVRTFQVKQITNMSICFSADGRFFSAGDDSGNVRVWDIRTGKSQLFADDMTYPDSPTKKVWATALSKTGDLLASAGGVNRIDLWDIPKGRKIRTLTGHTMRITSLTFSEDNRFLLSGSQDGTVRVWQVSNGKEQHTPLEHSLHISSMINQVSAWKKWVISTTTDGIVKFWDRNTWQEIASMMFFKGENDWMVMDPNGFFDGSPNAWGKALFRANSTPPRFYPLEQFFSQFFEPRLLSSTLMKGVPVIEMLRNRNDPRGKLDIQSLLESPLPKIRFVDSTKIAQTSQRVLQVDIVVEETGSGLRDLRVFRNNSLVHLERGKLKPDPSTNTINLRIPIKLTEGKNTLKAYVFNHKNLKSKDAVAEVTVVNSAKRKGKAYVIAIGVNNYSNPNYKLKYAVPDAHMFAERVGNSLQDLGKYSEVVSIVLSDKLATKGNIRTLLSRFSGSRTPLPLKLRPWTSRLTTVEPEDVLLFYFAGHGTARGDRYYLMPHDLGDGGDEKGLDAVKSQALLQHSLSDRELEESFEKMDAGNILLIIDACESGQALESEEPRRGPLNSRGLAQLAYEKGMYILAAAQAYESAVELDKLGHGLLTHVLVEEGLGHMQADTGPRDGKLTAREWFDYAIQGVPKEYEVAKQRHLQSVGRPIIFDQRKERVGRQVPRGYYRREISNQPLVIARKP